MGFTKFLVEMARRADDYGAIITENATNEALKIASAFEEVEREGAEKTFVDLREAIAYAIDNDTWSRVDNFLQYDWLLGTPILDGQEVIINADFNKSKRPELRFGFIHKGKNYWVVAVHQSSHLMIMVKEIDSEEYPSITAYYQWEKRALDNHRRITNQI